MDWEAMKQGRRQRMSLPTYPFERQSYWLMKQAIKPREYAKGIAPARSRLEKLPREELAHWFYMPGWKSSLPPVLPSSASVHRQHWLIFAEDAGDVGPTLQERLRSYQQDVILVIPGSEFQQINAGCYTISLSSVGDYDLLLRSLSKQGTLPERIVHLCSLSMNADVSLEDSLERGLYSLLYLTQALGNVPISSCKVTVVGNDLYRVVGNESILPQKATLQGAVRVIPLEYERIECQYIDIATADLSGQPDTIITALTAELLRETTNGVVALRHTSRWVQTYEAVSLSEIEEQDLRGLREGGVYLITGGLGGIGMAMAQHLACLVRPRLALSGRTALPAREEWPALLADNDSNADVCRKILQVQQLEEAGAEVLILTADVADEEQMSTAIAQIVNKFGELHGVIHAAGVPGMGLMQTKTPEIMQRVLNPKVRGTLVLDRVLQGHALDFLLLYSSITSITGGGPGQIDYCAANAFIDAFAQNNAMRHGRTIAINWGEWTWNAWEAGLAGYDQELQAFFKQNRQRFGITFDEGFAALRRVLLQPLPQIIVSTQHFPTIVELSTSFATATIAQNEQRAEAPGTRHVRPVLATPYVAPRSEFEQAIASIWSEFLGIEQIGLHDNFFELGGHSLVGSQIILRLRQTFDATRLPMSALFEAPTIAELRELIELALIEEIEQLEDIEIS